MGFFGDRSMLTLRSAREIAVIETVTTESGAKSGALDPATGLLYLPRAKMAPPQNDGVRPTQIPGTFEILVVAPKS